MRNPHLLCLLLSIPAAGCTTEAAEPPAPDEPAGPIYVTRTGADLGGCAIAAPCRTLSYAVRQVTASRGVIRVDTDRLVTAAPISIDRPVLIEGTPTTIDPVIGAPTFVIEAHAGTVAFEGLRVLGAPDARAPAITVARGSTLQLARSVLDTAAVTVDGGALELRDVKLTTPLPRVEAVLCTNGTVRVRGAEFVHATIEAAGCDLTVSRSRFDELTDGSIGALGGRAVIENNLIVQAYELADTMYLSRLGPGSAVRFNTFVNTSRVAADGIALYCEGLLDVTSNIFAYGSEHPLGPPALRCPARFSLFDTVAAAEQTEGEGNLVADASAMFADAAAGDFHLACESPARGAAEPCLAVSEDGGGGPRPAPLGTRADIGAFEAP